MLLAKGSGVDIDVATLAKQIKAEQSPEIEQLTSWLKGWASRSSRSTPGWGTPCPG